ncbi:hypothetical protein AVEN_30425-1 [Araneus ventricosus]|uniref:DDE Tnp4 domain-containing protein n=1 Tax=Araneus ventricosus TaxID=182803 RepID=A0A4Y2X3X3_ARAVE|nr:hypothetical protein AVEN_30425-1 [Araneus ventricosus]
MYADDTAILARKKNPKYTAAAINQHLEKLDDWYLATGCSLAELHFTFRVGKSTASQIVREVTGDIWSVLSEKEIPPLNNDLFLEIAQGFQDSTDFPHCIGALDGKHIRLVQPENSSSLFHNYKNFFQ